MWNEVKLVLARLLGLAPAPARVQTPLPVRRAGVVAPRPAPTLPPAPRPAAKATALQPIHEMMRHGDVVSIIGMCRTTGYVALPSPLASPQLDSRVRSIPDRMQRLPTGATNFAASLREARTMMARQPGGRVKRVILVSDGEDNVETDQVMPLVRELAAMKVRIDCVAFGPWSSTRRLEEIAAAARGRMLRARNLRELQDALRAASDRIPPRQAGGRLAAIAVLFDMSASMYEPMPEESGRRRVDVAVEAMLDWLNVQRATYA